MASDAAATTFITGADGFIGTAAAVRHGHAGIGIGRRDGCRARPSWTPSRSRRFRSAVSVFVTAAVVGHASAGLPASTTSTPMGCTPAASRDLRVHLINEAGAHQRTLDAAEAEAGTIWARAGLRLAWTSPPVPLDVPDGGTVVVIVRRALLRPAGVDSADSLARSDRTLGQVQFAKDGRPVNLIEVSFQALTWLVMSGSYFEKPISELPNFAQTHVLGRGLGRVVAHEIGHWLMGRAHTQQGLMRPTIDAQDLVEPNVPLLPRTWTAAATELLLPLSSRCELDAPSPGPRE